MAPTSEAPAFDLGVPPMPDKVPPKRIYTVIGFRADLEPRIEALARESTEAGLSEVKRADMRVTCGRMSLSPFSTDNVISS